MSKKFLSVAIVASVAATSTVGAGYAQETANNGLENTKSNNGSKSIKNNTQVESSVENTILSSSSKAASINGTEYDTLSDAISNANENDTIKLLNNIEENITLDKNIVIDGQGQYTIKGKTILKAGTLKNLTLTIDTNSLLLYIGNSNNTNITMDGVTVKYPVIGTTDTIVKTVDGNNANITIKNCTFMNEANNGDIVVDAPEWSYGLYVNEQGESGEFNFINSEFNGAFRTMLANINGTVNIEDSVFKNTIHSNNSDSAAGSKKEATCLTTAKSKGNFNIENNTFDNAGAMYFQITENANMVNNTIKFDKFEHFIQVSGNAGHELDLTKNSFEVGNNNLISVDVSAAPIILPVGQKAVNYWAWLYGSSKGDTNIENYIFEYKSRTNKIFYPGSEISLNEVIKSSDGNINIINGDTIKITKDIEVSKQIDLSGYSNITLDLNKKELSASESFGSTDSMIKTGKNTTIKNGKIKTSSSIKNAISITNKSEATLKNLVIDHSNGTDAAIDLNDSSLRIEGNLNIKSPNSGIYVNGSNSKVIYEDGSSLTGNDKITAGDGVDLGDVIEDNRKPSTGGGGSISKPEYTHTQIIGKDRYETAALLADKIGSYDTVILVNSDKTMADGLSAASLAGKLNAPILPVKQNKIPDSVMQRIEKAKNVYIIGGTEAISKDVENKLSDKKITRIGGETRFETSEKIAAMIGNYSEAYIVNGVTGEADAMSISSVAAKKGAPIIVTDGKKSDYEKKAGTDYTVIGGEKAVTEALEEKYSADRISGANRYETNRAVIMKYYASVGTIYLANGETMIDALTASLVAKDNGVVLVSEKSDNDILKSRNTVQIGGMPFEVNLPK